MFIVVSRSRAEIHIFLSSVASLLTIPLLPTFSFDEISSYCCQNAGGTIVTASVVSGQSSSSTSTPKKTFPTCRTTNYRDMLSCYDLIAGDHCKNHEISPVGLCSANTTDTSGGRGENGFSEVGRTSAGTTSRMKLLPLVACSTLLVTSLLSAML